MPYLSRHIAPFIRDSLRSFPCVFINGPRQSGKTTLARLTWPAPLATYVNFDDAAVLAIASGSPDSFLSGYTGPLILDEIQLVPELFRALKVRIDTKRAAHKGELSGLYILTGSTNVLALPQLSDALVGRMIIKTLYPLSATEIHQSPGHFIARLKKGDFKAGAVPKYNLIDTIQKATFPEIRNSSDAERTDWFRSYISTLIQRDIQHIMDIDKATLLPQLLRLMATRVGGILNDADLARSVKENAVTTKRYRTILDLLFLTLTVPPWFRNVGKRLIKSPKTYLMDTNLTCHMIGRSLKEVEQSDPALFGHLVENFVATELLKQISEPLHQSGLHHFRTGDGKEVDFVIEFPDQKIVGIEVKSSSTVTPQDMAGLYELQTLAGNDFAQGCILYRGQHILKMADKIWALPICMLWA